MAEEKKSHLTLYICLAIVFSIPAALLAPNLAAKLHVGGEIFLRLLKMIVVPLVVMSVMHSILSLGDIRKLGRPGGRTVLYYVSTTIIAVIVGLIFVNLFNPGAGVDTKAAIALRKETVAKTKVLDALAHTTGLEKSDIITVFKGLHQPKPEKADLRTILTSMVLMLFTDNLTKSAAQMNLLPLIMFSFIFAGMLTTMGERVRTVVEIVGQVNDALMAFVMLLMKVAPYGIFCLVASRFGQAHAGGEFLGELQRTAWYVVTVLSGLAFHAFVTLSLILWIFTRRNPFRFMYQMSQALLTAFSTASSSATIPVTMKCAIEKAGVTKRSAEFVVPLGATINMDGTALYEAVAALFIAQAYGIDLSMTQQITVALAATLAAIGAAGIPEAGLVTMIIVLNAVQLPIEGIGVILTVDWFLDRFRTAVNCFGDAVGSAVVEKSFIHLEAEQAKADE